MVEWSSYNGQYMAVVDPYMIQIHQTDKAWYFNCFIDIENRKQRWIGGSSLEDPSTTLKEAKRRSLQVVKDHRKTNR